MQMCVSSKRNSWRGGRVVMQQPAKLWPIFWSPSSNLGLRTSEKPASTRWLFSSDVHPSLLKGNEGAKDKPATASVAFRLSASSLRDHKRSLLSPLLACGRIAQPSRTPFNGRHEPMAPQTCRIFLQEQLPCSDVNFFKARPSSAHPSSSLASFVRPPACGQKAANAPFPAS